MTEHLTEPYFDELLLRVGLIDNPRERDKRYLEYMVVLPESYSPETSEVGSLDELASEVREIAWANPVRRTDTYVLDTYLNDVSWGADGSVLQLILDISTDIGTVALLSGISAFIRKYWPRRVARTYTDEELTEHARRVLARRYAIDYTLLTPAGLARVSGPEARTTAQFTHGGEKLDVTIVMVEGIPVIERTYRDIPPAPG
jgi:hypothetical protein